jgi:hypothetical protein
MKIEDLRPRGAGWTIGIARHAAADQHRLAGALQDRYPVPGLLSMPDGAITGCADRYRREFSSGAFSSCRHAISGALSRSQSSRLARRPLMPLTRVGRDPHAPFSPQREIKPKAVQHRPACFRRRQCGGTGFLPIRSSPSRREDLRQRPLIERKGRLGTLLTDAAPSLNYGDHVIGQGPEFYEKACAMKVEGIVSKRTDAPYTPGNRGLWREVKCLNRAEFVVVGWTDPEGRRPYLGALLLGYYEPDGRLIYAGRVGSGIDNAKLERLWRRLQPLAADTMPLDVAPPRGSRFGSPLVLSRVHWVRPELVAEVKFLTWTEDNLLWQVVYEGLREDKPAREVRREVPHP